VEFGVIYHDSYLTEDPRKVTKPKKKNVDSECDLLTKCFQIVSMLYHVYKVTLNYLLEIAKSLFPFRLKLSFLFAQIRGAPSATRRGT
jgi:hypothetical protein